MKEISSINPGLMLDTKRALLLSAVCHSVFFFAKEDVSRVRHACTNFDFLSIAHDRYRAHAMLVCNSMRPTFRSSNGK